MYAAPCYDGGMKRNPPQFDGAAPINLSKLAPDLLAMLVRVAHALNKASPGGAKITKKEWAEIGEAAGVVALDIVSDVVGKKP